MTTSRGLLRASLCLAGLALGQAGLSAQTSRELSAGPSGRDPLTLAVSALSTLESAPTTLVPPELGRMKFALGYNRPTRQSTLELAGSSVVPYTSGFRRDLLIFEGGLQASRIFGRRTRLSVSEFISKQPYDLSGLSGRSQNLGAPGSITGPLTTNGGLSFVRELRYDGVIALSRTLTRRATVDFSFAHTGSSLPRTPAATSQIVSARIARRVSPSTVFHMGYGFGVASFASADREVGRRHDIALGFSFERPLPFSGRTLFSASTGSTVLTDGRTHRLRLVASGSLSRDLGHTWTSSIAYSRPMQYVAGFRQPFLSDALTLNLDGRLGRAWLLSLTSGFARGTVGIASVAPGYDSYNASLRVRRQIARAWGVEAEVFATHFGFSGGDATDPALPSLMDRHGVRAGISWTTARRR